MGITKCLLTMKANSLKIFRIHQIKIYEMKINNNNEVLFLDNQLQSPLELFEDNFFITVRMILT